VSDAGRENNAEHEGHVAGEEDADGFYERVWAVVAEIPPGRVTTYGDIAAYLGRRGAARIVGWALNAAVGSGLPCHRVVNRNGALTGKRFFETPHVMEERLRSEGVAFDDEGCVVLDEHRWVPQEELEEAT
jgi:O-6-methylguanine DNA methyltransferase